MTAYHVNPAAIDFVAHAASMGAKAVKARDISALEAELAAAKGSDRPVVIVIDTDPGPVDRGRRVLVGCGRARGQRAARSGRGAGKL